MLSTGERPRELRWYHAGPMLFGDWGTSRLYVLGLAFLFNGRASFYYVAAMSVILVGVGWCYQIICRLYPDGGGVYSAAKHRSQLLAVVGGLLLCADYVVTASLSCLDAFHYLGVQELRFFGFGGDALLAAGTILAIGGLNYFGPRKAGTVAMVVALATVAMTLVIAAFCLPHLHTARFANPFSRGPWESWRGLTEIVLALSGVEAVANMTGIMVEPIERTARRSIVPVMCEIVVLNLILAAAMNTLPDSTLMARTPSGALAHTGDMLKVIAKYYVGPGFAAVSAVVFAALLLSAVNTALADLVSIQFMLSRDRELPRPFSGLNRFGMPVLPLVVAAIVPAVVLLLFPRVEALADLYAIGVIGAIAINLGSTSTNREVAMKAWERGLMLLMTLVLIAIELTICVVKPHARGFALVVLVIGLAGRLVTIVANRNVPLGRATRGAYLGFAAACVAAVLGLAFTIGETWLGFGLSAAVAVGVGWASYQTQGHRLALIAAESVTSEAPTAAPSRMMVPGAYKPRERIMVATQGNPRLLNYALKQCKSREAELQLLYLRPLAITPMGPAPAPPLAEDHEAQELFERVRHQAHDEGVPVRLLYGVTTDVPYAILDMAVTHGADTLLLGATRRGALWRAMKGDVISAVAESLPEGIDLLIHA